MESAANLAFGSHAFQHSFQVLVAQKCTLSGKSLVSFESPERHFLFLTAILGHAVA
jgi:hypothetical protein